MLMGANADLEIVTTDCNTALLRAVKNRNPEIVKLLLDKKAKLNAADKNGDTALHVAMRAGSKTIIETILRNPKNSQLLYKPNNKGETPYNIDLANPKPILSQLFGARKLNTNETTNSENLLGYEIYGSALANILAEPSLSLPITVGLYAKWGSGKSLLINKLQNELKNWTKVWIEPSLKMSPFLFLVIFHLTCFTGLAFWMLSHFLDFDKNYLLTPFVMVTTILMSYFTFFVINSNARTEIGFICWINTSLAKILNHFELLAKILFCHPPGEKKKDAAEQCLPIKLFFTDQTKVSTTVGGEDTVTMMIGSLIDGVENYYGRVVTRLFRALKPAKNPATSSLSFRKFLGIPFILMYILTVLLGVIEISLIILAVETNQKLLDATKGWFETYIHVMLILVSSILALVAVINIPTIFCLIKSMFYSQRSYLQHTLAGNSYLVKVEGQLQAIRLELQYLVSMVKALDSFTHGSSRLILIVDGLDIVEQRKVLKVLDTVNNLFYEPDNPFIILLAIDPHIIIKAIELNINEAFADTSVGGYAYLRNMVHLPFFLQNNGSKKIRLAQKLSAKNKELFSVDSETKMKSQAKLFESNENMFARIASYSRFDKHAIPTEMNRMFLADDYFSDVNPRSMRRLMNCIYVMGRLLKAFTIEFNWHHLSVWINIAEQWPYRTSWMINFVEENEDSLELDTPLLSVYEKIKNHVPPKIDASFNDMDRDKQKLEIFLKLHKKTLTVKSIKMFFPFTINLDPYIKKLIKDYLNQREMMGLPIPDILTKSQGLTKAKGSPLQWMIHQEKIKSQNSDQKKDFCNISACNLIPLEYKFIR